MNGIELIAAERKRQVEVEGWTAEHDDSHRDGGMAKAAACYANPRRQARVTPRLWPWAKWYWKPGERIRELVKAGALIAAEIDRLQRTQSKDQPT